MRRRRAIGLLASGSLLAVAACSAIAGLDGDFTVAGVGPDTSPDASRDAQSDVNETGPLEASVDAAIDAGADADASDGAIPIPFDPNPPVVLPNGASKRTWCVDGDPTNRPWCWDFNDLTSANAPKYGWTAAFPPDGTGLSIVHTGTSGTDALEVLRADTTSFAYLSVDIANSPHLDPATIPPDATLALSFRFRIIQVGHGVVMCGFRFFGRDEGLAFFPGACGDGKDCLGENAVAGRAIDATEKRVAFGLNTWYQGGVKLTRTTTGWGSTITVGDKTIVTRTIDAMPTTGAADVIHVVAGAISTETGTESIVDIDDTVVYTTGILLPP